MEKIKAEILDPATEKVIGTELINEKFWLPNFPAKIYYAGQVLTNVQLKKMNIDSLVYIQVRKVF